MLVLDNILYIVSLSLSASRVWKLWWLEWRFVGFVWSVDLGAGAEAAKAKPYFNWAEAEKYLSRAESSRATKIFTSSFFPFIYNFHRTAAVKIFCTNGTWLLLNTWHNSRKCQTPLDERRLRTCYRPYHHQRTSSQQVVDVVQHVRSRCPCSGVWNY